MRVLQSVQILKFGKWLEISVLGFPDVKKVVLSPWSVRTYVRTTGLNGKKYKVYKISQERFFCKAMKFGMISRYGPRTRL
jgi:hypothetical protein